MKITLLRNVHSWQDFKSRTANLSNKNKGDAFELLVKYYLLINPLYKTKLKSVWLLNEISIKLKQNLNLPDTDQGIDLVAETYEGEYWAIQCKYRDDEDTTISWREVSTFAGLSFSVCKNISFGLICTTSNRITKVLSKQENIAFCTGEIWRNLDAEFFTTLNSLIRGKVKAVKALKPRPHQKSAIKNALKHFIADDNARGKMIMPCGSGKSLTAFWIADKLEAKSILVAVPSLALIRQSLKSWLRESLANKKEIKWICVASDETVGSIKKDDVAILKQDLGVPVFTDSERIAAWLKENKKYTKVVFTTYQSGKSIADATKKANIVFDLGIMDEAHKTVGSRNKLFSYLLFDDNIRIKKRIFMTATERRYAGLRDEIISMEDPSIYGETFELQTFKEAIEVKPPILSDYKILTIVVTRDEIEELIENNAYVIPDKGSWDDEIEAEMLATNIALQKAVEKYPIRHAISFHSSISKARAFQNTQTRYSDTFQKAISISSYHVSGNMPTSDRDKIIGEFLTNSPSLITNARCLTEGVDIPNVDCVLFADPKRSTVDIVQAVGRALRKSEGKEYGYVIIPVLTNAEKDDEEILDSESFKEVLATLRALASNDERIIEYFKSITERKKTNKIINIELDEKVARKIDSKEFIESIELKIWDKLAKLSWRPFEEARSFVRSLGLKKQEEWRKYCGGEILELGIKPPDIPTSPDKKYRDEVWISMGDWLGSYFIAHQKRIYLNFEDGRQFAHQLNLSGQVEWSKYVTGQLPDKPKRSEDIPANPSRVYKNKGWINWGDWLGTGNIATIKFEYLPFNKAKKFIRSKKFQSITEWREYYKNTLKNNAKIKIPSKPDRTYRNAGWISWADWLGTEHSIKNIATSKRKFLAFEEARRAVRKLNVQSAKEWKQFTLGNKPEIGILSNNIPTNPNRTYKNSGWISWGDWLGTGRVALKRIGYLPFYQARRFARSLKLLSTNEWRKFCRGEIPEKGFLPEKIPSNPHSTYKNSGWKGYGDWLGTKNISPRQKKSWYLCINDSKRFVHTLNLKNKNEWFKYCKGNLSNKAKKPENIPTYSSTIYKNKGWISWADWLGKEDVRKKDYTTYNEAKIFVHQLKLKSQNEWYQYIKGELKGKTTKPKNIPSYPSNSYKNKGWISWADWLNTKTIPTQAREYLPYEMAKEFVHNLKLLSANEWRRYCKGELKKKKTKLVAIPNAPNWTYRDKGWKSWGDWLGTDRIATNYIDYVQYTDGRDFAMGLGLRTSKEWFKYCKGQVKGRVKLPSNIPVYPYQTYKYRGWKSWGDWLGTGNISSSKIKFRSFKSAKKFVHTLGIKNGTEWRRFPKDLLPPDIPKLPWKIYKSKGWKGMKDWLGTW